MTCARIGYGGLTLGVVDDKHVEITRDGQSRRVMGLDKPIEFPKDGIGRYRLVVVGKACKLFLGERELHKERLTDQPDPWLSFQQAGEGRGRVIDAELFGKPSVPDRLELSLSPTLAGWRADYFAESLFGDDRSWEKSGDEIHARGPSTQEELKSSASQNYYNPYTRRDPMPILPGTHQESVLKYHKPLIEDCELRYEFFYEPGKVLVHPA